MHQQRHPTAAAACRLLRASPPQHASRSKHPAHRPTPHTPAAARGAHLQDLCQPRDALHLLLVPLVRQAGQRRQRLRQRMHQQAAAAGTAKAVACRQRGERAKQTTMRLAVNARAVQHAQCHSMNVLQIFGKASQKKGFRAVGAAGWCASGSVQRGAHVCLATPPAAAAARCPPRCPPPGANRRRCPWQAPQSLHQHTSTHPGNQGE